jgi:selenoprotein S
MVLSKFLFFLDYNPLTGEGGGGSCAWRPGRKGPAKGG